MILPDFYFACSLDYLNTDRAVPLTAFSLEFKTLVLFEIISGVCLLLTAPLVLVFVRPEIRAPSKLD